MGEVLQHPTHYRTPRAILEDLLGEIDDISAIAVVIHYKGKRGSTDFVWSRMSRLLFVGLAHALAHRADAEMFDPREPATFSGPKPEDDDDAA